MPRKKETEEQKQKRLAHDEKVRIQKREIDKCDRELDFIVASAAWKGDCKGLVMGLANKVIEEKILEDIKNGR